MRLWICRQGRATLKVRATDINHARERAASLGMRNPWAIVLYEGKP